MRPSDLRVRYGAGLASHSSDRLRHPLRRDVTVCTGFLLTQRTLRSLMVAATSDFELTESASGVRALATAGARRRTSSVAGRLRYRVSAGPVFAGNIGAENRYEYTVVGDAVNDAARLADRAKEV